MSGIFIENLYLKRGNREILSGLNFSAPYGHSVCILGRSGSGKSTLLKAITGFLKPDSGEIKVNDQQVQFGKMIRDAGIVFQDCALFDDLTVEENILFGMNLPKSLADERLKEVMESVGLKEIFSPFHPDELSGGMKKKAALARALARRPKLLIMDEPTSGFDPVSADRIIDLILKVKREWGLSILLITHDPSMALRLTESSLFIHEGKAEFAGKTDEIIYSESRAVKEFIGAFTDSFSIMKQKNKY